MDERGDDPAALLIQLIARGGEKLAGRDNPVAFFISEHLPDPSHRSLGEELWVEVTILKKGPPRSIYLGVKKGDDPVVPLHSGRTIAALVEGVASDHL